MTARVALATELVSVKKKCRRPSFNGPDQSAAKIAATPAADCGKRYLV